MAGKRSYVALSVLGVVATALLALAVNSQEHHVLDLTVNPPDNPKRMGAPGSAVAAGGSAMDSSHRQYSLPWELRILEARPASVSPNRESVVQVQLRNSGETDVYLPQFRDPRDAQQQGEKERRTFLFMIRFLDAGRVNQADKILAFTVGAKTIPESLLRVKPDESVLVKLPVGWAAISDHLSPGMAGLRIQIVCKEWTLADDRYFIERRSEELLSENTAWLAIEPASSSPDD